MSLAPFLAGTGAAPGLLFIFKVNHFGQAALCPFKIEISRELEISYSQGTELREVGVLLQRLAE